MLPMMLVSRLNHNIQVSPLSGSLGVRSLILYWLAIGSQPQESLRILQRRRLRRVQEGTSNSTSLAVNNRTYQSETKSLFLSHLKQTRIKIKLGLKLAKACRHIS